MNILHLDDMDEMNAAHPREIPCVYTSEEKNGWIHFDTFNNERATDRSREKCIVELHFRFSAYSDDDEIEKWSKNIFLLKSQEQTRKIEWDTNQNPHKNTHKFDF